MNELERVREQALLTDGALRANIDDTPRFTTKFFDIRDLRAVAQAQLDKALKFVRIECDKPTLPYLDESTGCDLSLEQIRIVKQMLKPDSEGNHWVKVRPKGEK